MKRVKQALDNLNKSLDDKEKRVPVSFADFLNQAANKPEIIFRDIFQLFYDMMHDYIPAGSDEYPNDPESINFIHYDCRRLFVDNCDTPFFADRLFANRLVSLADSLKQGAQQNKIYFFEGPHGSGKTTFLNNLLSKFEEYTGTERGMTYETIWKLDVKTLGGFMQQGSIINAPDSLEQVMEQQDDDGCSSNGQSGNALNQDAWQRMAGACMPEDYLYVPCPSHDHPILQVPKPQRKSFLDQLITDEKFKKKMFHEKEYEWIFKEEPCTICTSIYNSLLDKMDSSEIFEMLFARKCQFNRRLGEGISVYNPGDRIQKQAITNDVLRNMINSLFRDSSKVHYVYSSLAKANNGIFAIMDVKSNNQERLKNLHGIISDGIHKVDHIEERINSLFICIINPEDYKTSVIDDSFRDRSVKTKLGYTLDYGTEVEIYKGMFGRDIENQFLPRVLENFAKAVISSRLNQHSQVMKKWIKEPSQYSKYCDSGLFLLKMDIYTGLIPEWLSDEHRKTFNAKTRRNIIRESECEGEKGFSGRESIKIFNQFYSMYGKTEKPITMKMVSDFFINRKKLASKVPDNFLGSLVQSYDYTVLQEVKESLYYYNEDRISKDVQNYMFAINFDPGDSIKCIYTKENIDVSHSFFDTIEWRLVGSMGPAERARFREEKQKEYVSKTMHDIGIGKKDIKETELYKDLYERYVNNLKENTLDPFINNDNFRSAIKDYRTDTFKSYDRRIRQDVQLLMKNLQEKFGYNGGGAKQVCIYVIDKKLAEQFSKD